MASTSTRKRSDADATSTDEPTVAEVTETERDTSGDTEVTSGQPTATGDNQSTGDTEPDLGAVTAALEAYVSDSSEDNGKKIQAAYNDLDRSGKGAATRLFTGLGKDAIKAKDRDRAFAIMDAKDSWLTATSTSSGGTTRTPAEPVNPTDGFVERLAALNLAYRVAKANAPEGLDEDWADRVKSLVESDETTAQVESLVAWNNSTAEDKGEAPEVSDTVARAVRQAFVGSKVRKSGTTGERTVHYNGPRRSIGAHISSAFADQPSGAFLSVADIRGHKSTEYGDDAPSAGAISAAIKSGKQLADGLTSATQDGKAGISKA